MTANVKEEHIDGQEMRYHRVRNMLQVTELQHVQDCEVNRSWSGCQEGNEGRTGTGEASRQNN